MYIDIAGGDGDSVEAAPVIPLWLQLGRDCCFCAPTNLYTHTCTKQGTALRAGKIGCKLAFCLGLPSVQTVC